MAAFETLPNDALLERLMHSRFKFDYRNPMDYFDNLAVIFAREKLNLITKDTNRSIRTNSLS